MKLSKADLIKEWAIGVEDVGFPKEILSMNDTDICIVYYTEDAKRSIVTGISEIEIVQKITLSIYKKANVKAAFIQFPIDTQNSITYLIFNEFVKNNTKAVSALKSLYAKCYKLDYDRANKIAIETSFNNSFKIYDRNSFQTAIANYLYAPDSVVSVIYAIFDSFCSYTKLKHNKNLYGGIISKIVTMISDGNGGVIREAGRLSILKYLYAGINSELLLDVNGEYNQKREKAVALYRERVSIEDIYLATGWYLNTYDGLWRYLIPDNDAKLITWKPNNFGLYTPKNSNAEKSAKTIYQAIINGNYNKLNQIRDTWDCTLSDIIDHPILFKHYPSLAMMPVFYAHNNTDEYSYFYDPQNHYILIHGNFDTWDIKAVLLHETQHAIQQIEGFGSGGNETFASLITSAGAEGFKQYLISYANLKRGFSSHWSDFKKYSYDNFVSKVGGNYMTSDKYYSDINVVIQFLLNFRSDTIVNNFLDDAALSDCIKKIKDSWSSKNSAIATLKAQGYTDIQIQNIYFSNYEMLLGELESRNVQQILPFEASEAGYFIPLSTESYLKDKVVVYTKSTGITEEIPIETRAAIEYDLKSYIIHLRQSNDIKPILHELGHLVYAFYETRDIEIDRKINENIPYDIISEYKFKSEEIFCDIFLCYLESLNLDATFNVRIKSNDSKLVSYVGLFKEQFDKIFKGDNSNKTLIMLSNMNEFLKQLDIITDY